MKDKIKSAQISMKIAVILRLLMIALTAVLFARKCSDEYAMLFRIYQGAERLISLTILVSGFVFDTIFTVLWLYRSEVYEQHRTVYVGLGGIFYLLYAMEYYHVVLDGFGLLIGIVYAPFLWVIGLIPFLIYGRGRDRLWWENKKTSDHDTMDYDQMWKQ